jgi:hypothetical protein
MNSVDITREKVLRFRHEMCELSVDNVWDFPLIHHVKFTVILHPFQYLIRCIFHLFFNALLQHVQ